MSRNRVEELKDDLRFVQRKTLEWIDDLIKTYDYDRDRTERLPSSDPIKAKEIMDIQRPVFDQVIRDLSLVRKRIIKLGRYY